MAVGERLQHSGNAPQTTLDGAINSSTSSVVVVDGTGYPDGSVGPFWIVVDPSQVSEEKIKCASRTGNTITAVTSPSTGRGADSTTATSHVSGAVVQHILSANELDLLNQHINDQNDNHQALLNTTRHDTTARHALGSVVAAGTPGSSAIGDAAAAGVSTSAARADHTHAREAAGIPGNSAVGDSAAAGNSATVARANHTHGREAFAILTGNSPLQSVGTTKDAGSNTTVPRGDHVHNAPQHLRLSGRSSSSLAGGTPPAAGTGPWLEQSGSQQMTFTGGSATLTFPAAFPSGLLSVHVSNADPSVHNGTTFTYGPSSIHPPTTSTVEVYLGNDDGGVVGTGKTIWVSWSAKGW